MGSGNGSGTREIKLAVPEGMDPRAAEMIFRQLLEEFHDMEPLAVSAVHEMAAQGVLNDMPKLAMFRRRLAEAPAGAHWGITIADSSSVFLPGAKGGNQIFIEAACKMRDAKSENLNRVISTLTCWALLTSAAARGLLAMHGIGMKLTPPFELETEEVDDGDGA